MQPARCKSPLVAARYAEVLKREGFLHLLLLSVCPILATRVPVSLSSNSQRFKQKSHPASASDPKKLFKGTCYRIFPPHSSPGSNVFMEGPSHSRWNLIYSCLPLSHQIPAPDSSGVCAKYPLQGSSVNRKPNNKRAHYWKVKYTLTTFLNLLRLHLNLKYHLQVCICLFLTWSCKHGRSTEMSFCALRKQSR